MREIKFRGWDATGQKGWVFGDLVHNKKVTRTGLEDRVMVGGYEVVPESVGLYSGYHDMDGKEIYEGDIVTTCKCYIDDPSMYIGDVIWSEEFAGLAIRLEERDGDLKFLYHDKHIIIGSVFENKVLLKKEA